MPLCDLLSAFSCWKPFASAWSCNIEVQMSVSEERVIFFRTGGSDCAICASFDVNLSFAVDNNWGSKRASEPLTL